MIPETVKIERIPPSQIVVTVGDFHFRFVMAIDSIGRLKKDEKEFLRMIERVAGVSYEDGYMDGIEEAQRPAPAIAGRIA